MKITITTSEAVPFAKTGGLADVVTALGKHLTKLGNEVTIMMPLYPGSSLVPTALITPLRLSFSGRNVTYSLIESMHSGVKFLFVDAPSYFHRRGIYGDAAGDYPDNDERFVFFTRACLEYCLRKGDPPDVFHCNDWPTALFPLFLRTHYSNDALGKTPVVFTIHNIAYQGIFPAQRFNLLELGNEYFTADTLEFYGSMNFLKAGLLYSDILTTVSKQYSQEIQSKEQGYRLDGVVRARSNRLFPVLNGIDDEIWNPETDSYLSQNYSLSKLQGKSVCRKELLRKAGFDMETDSPLIGMISRLAAQKGFDLLEAAAKEILKANMLLFILGTGESKYETFFQRLHQRNPGQVAVALRFDEALAHKIEAGADMFLMPSQYEPCGMNQLYSLAYGTVPIVRAVGGLDDTVQEWDP